MTTDVKLLPCPFCGDAEHLMTEHLEGTILHPACRVLCDNCGASTGYTDKNCRSDWNTRAPNPLLARAERLAEALQWYAEQAEGCRKIGSIGEPFRKELDRDGGKRARAALRDHDQEAAVEANG